MLNRATKSEAEGSDDNSHARINSGDWLCLSRLECLDACNMPQRDQFPSIIAKENEQLQLACDDRVGLGHVELITI
jgi:hypothetical protein